jgi:DNA-binding CsgD family transcriptional regulator
MSRDEAVVAVDEKGRIRVWNAAAERLLGRTAAAVVGRPCHEVVRGRDVFGNSLCHENCSVQVMARRGEAVQPFQWIAHTGPGVHCGTGVNVTTVPGERKGQFTLVHVLQPNGPTGDPHTLDRAAVAAGLSPREIEVLSAVARGLKNREIAAELQICLATVRNHVQSLIQKLQVRSKLEAVALLLRMGAEGTSPSN